MDKGNIESGLESVILRLSNFFEKELEERNQKLVLVYKCGHKEFNTVQYK